MTDENPYAPTKAPVADEAVEADAKPSVGARFAWTAAIAFPVFLFFVLVYTPKAAWTMGALGSVMFAAFCGIIAMCIPTRSKAAFIVPSILAGLVVAYMIGSSGS